MDNPFKTGTHNHFIINILNDGQWHNVIDIMARYGTGIRNMAIRSRVSDINRYCNSAGLNWHIESRIGGNRQGEYRLTPGIAQNGAQPPVLVPGKPICTITRKPIQSHGIGLSGVPVGVKELTDPTVNSCVKKQLNLF